MQCGSNWTFCALDATHGVHGAYADDSQVVATEGLAFDTESVFIVFNGPFDDGGGTCGWKDPFPLVVDVAQQESTSRGLFPVLWEPLGSLLVGQVIDGRVGYVNERVFDIYVDEEAGTVLMLDPL